MNTSNGGLEHSINLIMLISICLSDYIFKKKSLFDLATIRVPPRIRWSCLLSEIARCTFNQRPILQPLLVFASGARHHILPCFPVNKNKNKKAQNNSKAADGQIQTDQIQGPPANCSDMSNTAVCLVTPHPSTLTKVGSDSPLELRAPSGLQRPEA